MAEESAEHVHPPETRLGSTKRRIPGPTVTAILGLVITTILVLALVAFFRERERRMKAAFGQPQTQTVPRGP